LKLTGVSCGYVVERVTRIELALSAWEVCGAVSLPAADSVTCGMLMVCPWAAVTTRRHPYRRARSGHERIG